jgi:OOP family OmpA-OmpF porin
MDHDGITDDKDKCPTQAGVPPDGCPPGDMDNDGFTDDKDKCPDIPGIAPNGCPPGDRDHDGFKDDQDKCPDEAGVAPDGCPIRDRDHDGIPDAKDKCPDKPETLNGYKDDDGCPDELPKAVKKFTGVIRGIQFAFGKATIRPQSKPLLDRAAKVLDEYKDLRVRITGHTDNIGKHDDNVTLSQKRADSVKAYLVKKGVDASRIETQGMGPDEPIAKNNTPEGRAKNRRIEFHLIHRAAPAQPESAGAAKPAAAPAKAPAKAAKPAQK